MTRQSLRTLQSRSHDRSTPLRRQIADLGPWFHNLHLPDGTRTAPDHPLGDFPRNKWERVAPHLPDDLTGWNVLDVGCNAGFYSFALAARGASVQAVDGDAHYLRQARWAAAHLPDAERVRFEQADVYELAARPARWDLVWFTGVFYHLRHPLLALDLLAARASRLLVFQTLTLPDAEPLEPPEDVPFEACDRLAEPGWPRMAFVEHRLAGDPTNWWLPNRARCEAMLRTSGLRVLARPIEDTYVCAPRPAAEESDAAPGLAPKGAGPD